MEHGTTREKIFSELGKSTHRKLEEYFDVCSTGAHQDPDFFAHLIAWNQNHGEVRDSKLALPLIVVDSFVKSGLHVKPQYAPLLENALAHLALQPPRDLLRAVRFAKDRGLGGRRRALPKLVGQYLNSRIANYSEWERDVVRHRKTLKELYAFCRINPGDRADQILFKQNYPANSTFEGIANLKRMEPLEAAGFIRKKRLPFLVSAPGLAKNLEDGGVMCALISTMTPNEINSHLKMMDRRALPDPAAKAELEKALGRSAKSKQGALKMHRALGTDKQGSNIIKDEGLRRRVAATVEKKLDKGSVKGDWLILADCSSSMSRAIQFGTELAGNLARAAEGNTHLVFFNTSPTYYNVTGKTLDEIKALTRFVVASGSTSIGCGLDAMLNRGLNIDGIAIVSDGGENSSPSFSAAYQKLRKKLDKDVPVYFYQMVGDRDVLSHNCHAASIPLTTYSVSGGDYYSIPNLVQGMRTNRYSLIDEVMETPLLLLASVLAHQGLQARA